MSEDPKLFVRRAAVAKAADDWSFAALADEAEFNLFRYCGNDPIDFTDPMGLFPERDFITGVSDVVTFGHAEKIADFFYPNYSASLDKSSTAYKLGSTGGIAAAMLNGEAEAALATKLLSNAGKRLTFNPTIYAQLEEQLARDGAQSITRALKTAEQTLAEHKDKLVKIRAEGGYTSKVETTIKHVETQIETLNKFISDKTIDYPPIQPK